MKNIIKTSPIMLAMLVSILFTQRTHTQFVAPGVIPVVATASNDKTVKIWDTQTEKCVQTLVHESPVLSVALNPHPGKQHILASASENGTIQIWNWKTGKHIKTLKIRKFEKYSASSVAFSPHPGEENIMASTHKKIRYGTRERTYRPRERTYVKIWNISKPRGKKCINTLTTKYRRPKEKGPLSIAFHPHKKSTIFIAHGQKLQTFNWRLRGKQPIYLPARRNKLPITLIPHQQNVVALFVSSYNFYTINLETQRGEGSLPNKLSQLFERPLSSVGFPPLQLFKQPLSSIAFAPHRKDIIAYTKKHETSINILNSKTGNIQILQDEDQGHTKRINAVAFSPFIEDKLEMLATGEALKSDVVQCGFGPGSTTLRCFKSLLF